MNRNLLAGHRQNYRWSRVHVGLRGVLLAIVFSFGLLSNIATHAQENANPPAAAGANEGAVAANPPGANAAPPAAPADESYLMWTFRALGWSYTLAFLFLSFTLVALIVMNILMARRENICPLALVEGFEAHLNAEEYQQAYELARADESFLGQVLSAGLAKLSSADYAHAVEAMQQVGEEENMKFDHRLSYMSLIGTISPMVGLLGTVDGMVRSFTVIANSTTTPKPSELAQGISTALVTTLVGLILAIPAIAAYNLLRNRIARLTLEVGILSDNLMGRFKGKIK